jgi:hypothetical protein
METALLAGLGMAGIYTLSKNIDPRKNIHKGDPYLRQPHPHFSNNPSNYQGKGNNNQMLEETTLYNTRPKDTTTVNDYYNPNQTTDKHYDINNFSKVGTDRATKSMQGTTFKSLTGEVVHTNEFHHNNMAPYFGGKIKGAGPDVSTSEIYLDNKVGAGSQQFNKREQAPLFKPQKDLHWATGTPSNSDFIQGRINASYLQNNVKPWNEIQVGPSLSGNAGVDGSGGFNSGLEYRETYLPKRVDELRVESNPKLTYSLSSHEGAAGAYVKNRGELGQYNYHGPEKYFINNPERYLVTTGMEKAPAGRGIHELKDQARVETTAEYQGIAGQTDNVRAAMAPHNYQEAKHDHVYGSIEGPAYAGGHYDPTTNDYSSNGYAIVPNNRAANSQRTIFGTVKGIIDAVVSPIVDTMRPTRKENVIGNMIERGNVGKGETNSIYIISPETNARTTYREMDPSGKQHVFIGNQYENQPFLGNSAYLDAPHPQHRDTTTRDHTGIAGDSTMGVQHQSHVRDNQRNNNNRITAESRIHGNTNMFNSDINSTRDTSRGSYNYSSFGHSQSNVGLLGPDNYAQVTSTPVQYRDRDDKERINPDLLQAFKNNPYTHSLNSVY